MADAPVLGVVTLDGVLVEEVYAGPLAPTKRFDDRPAGTLTLTLSGTDNEVYGYLDKPGAIILPGAFITGSVSREGIYDTDVTAKCGRCGNPVVNLYRWRAVAGTGPFCMLCWDDITLIRQEQAA